MMIRKPIHRHKNRKFFLTFYCLNFNVIDELLILLIYFKIFFFLREEVDTLQISNKGVNVI